jgi:hypothetical protein
MLILLFWLVVIALIPYLVLGFAFAILAELFRQ